MGLRNPSAGGGRDVPGRKRYPSEATGTAERLRGGDPGPIRANPGRGEAESWVEEILGKTARPAVDPRGSGGVPDPETCRGPRESEGYRSRVGSNRPAPPQPAFADRRSAISGLKRVSRPGQRTYVGHSEIPKVLGGMGTAIVSTSSGVMTGHEARQAGVGGEVVARVW